MNQRHLWGATAIIASVIVVGFFLSAPHTAREMIQKQTELPSVPQVAVRDVYRKGKHTLTGTVTVPTACTSVSATSSATTNQINIVVTTEDPQGVCLDLPRDVSFTSILVAPADLPIVVQIDGKAASTTPL